MPRVVVRTAYTLFVNYCFFSNFIASNNRKCGRMFKSNDAPFCLFSSYGVSLQFEFGKPSVKSRIALFKRSIRTLIQSV